MHFKYFQKNVQNYYIYFLIIQSALYRFIFACLLLIEISMIGILKHFIEKLGIDMYL